MGAAMVNAGRTVVARHLVGLGLVAGAAAAALGGCQAILGIEEAETLAAPGGGSPGCSAPSECDDGNPCSADLCDDGRCSHAPLDGPAPPAQQQDGDCKLIACSAGQPSVVVDAADVPVDGLECTDDRCNGSTPENIPLPAETPCAGTNVCDDVGNCVECFSNDQCQSPDTCGGTGTEGVCGCTPTTSCTSAGATCGAVLDTTCNKPINCDNAVKDGSETDVDCGGSVNSCSVRCNAGQSCLDGTDCASGTCNAGSCG
jgi:hypothetical protein